MTASFDRRLRFLPAVALCVLSVGCGKQAALQGDSSPTCLRDDWRPADEGDIPVGVSRTFDSIPISTSINARWFDGFVSEANVTVSRSSTPVEFSTGLELTTDGDLVRGDCPTQWRATYEWAVSISPRTVSASGNATVLIEDPKQPRLGFFIFDIPVTPWPEGIPATIDGQQYVDPVLSLSRTGEHTGVVGYVTVPGAANDTATAGLVSTQFLTTE